MLNKYYSPEDLNTKFESDYNFLVFVLKKYKIADGCVKKFASNFYCLQDVRPIFTWRKKNKVPAKLWNFLHKELILARLTGKIKEDEIMSFEDLQKQFDYLGYKVEYIKGSIKIEYSQKEKEYQKKYYIKKRLNKN